MNRNDKTTKRSNLLVLGILAATLGYAQLPEDYLTKVSFHEKKDVTYSLPTEGDLRCLTLSELSQYHGYMQLYTMDEYVDQEGELLTDQNFIEERDVRDDWMESYSRVTVGKATIDIYTKESGLRTQIPVEQDEEAVYMTPVQAASYGFLDLDGDYYTQLKDELQELELAVEDNNGILSASNANIGIVYDGNTKIASSTEYDSTGLKTKESVLEYALTDEGDTYYPMTETVIEWFLGENGCCIRKITKIRRYAYQREVAEGYSPKRENAEGNQTAYGAANGVADYAVVAQENSDIFRVQSKKHRNAEVTVTVYDMAGKKILHTQAKAGEAIQLPTAARVGMYLVHIYGKDKHKPVVGKLLKSHTGSQF